MPVIFKALKGHSITQSNATLQKSREGCRRLCITRRCFRRRAIKDIPRFRKYCKFSNKRCSTYLNIFQYSVAFITKFNEKFESETKYFYTQSFCNENIHLPYALQGRRDWGEMKQGQVETVTVDRGDSG